MLIIQIKNSIVVLRGKTQQAHNISITFVQRRPNVFDVGLTLYKGNKHILCLMGRIEIKPDLP